MVLKTDISKNKFEAIDIPIFSHEEAPQSYGEMQAKNVDNIFTMVKSLNNFKVGICVCMYSEDKSALESTLVGIGENIDRFVRNGVSSDQIGVFVIIDGIEKAHQSVVEYFENLEKESEIFLSEEHNETMAEVIRATGENAGESIYLRGNRYNNLLFTGAELQDRQQRRFINRKT